MSPFDGYLRQILGNVDVPADAKREMYEEFHDHLEQLRQGYLAEGAQDAHAVKLAIADFGESNLVGELMNDAVTPNRLWLRIAGWLAFSFYALVVVYELLLNPSRLLGIRSYYQSFKLKPNTTPFRSIREYAYGYHHYNFDIWFFNLFGNVLLFVPLGFLLPILFSKARRFPMTVLWSLLASLAIELTQYATHLGSFDVDDLILNALGGAIGYAAWAVTASGWRLAQRKLRPALQ